ncbi:MAG: prefoldin subunit beta [Candidatus Thermoplasmatota archaeon]|nr:prefoldin subunit beta [Candidatus Thermoplasmatota archaeon]
MASEIPPQVQEQVRRFQETQQQLQAILSQKQQIEMQVRELDRTVTALGDIGEGTPVFRSVGEVLVGVDDPAELKSEMAEQKETLEVRLKSIERQESSLRERMSTLQNKLESMLGGAPQAGGPGQGA